MPKALSLDVGDVLMEHKWRLLELLSAKLGRDLGGRGPFDPDTDPAWGRALRGEISLDPYSDATAQSAGYDDRITLWRAMAHEPRRLVGLPV